MRNANKALALAYYRENVRKAAGGVALAVAFICLLYWMQVIVPLHRERDVSGAAVQHSNATVLRMTSLGERRGTGPVPLNTVTLRLNGEEVICNSPAIVSVGEPVRVYYQVGRSGTIYVTSLQPVNP